MLSETRFKIKIFTSFATELTEGFSIKEVSVPKERSTPRYVLLCTLKLRLSISLLDRPNEPIYSSLVAGLVSSCCVKHWYNSKFRSSLLSESSHSVSWSTRSAAKFFGPICLLTYVHLLGTVRLLGEVEGRHVPFEIGIIMFQQADCWIQNDNNGVGIHNEICLQTFLRYDVCMVTIYLSAQQKMFIAAT